MGRKPGERVTGLLEQQAEAIALEFNSQDIEDIEEIEEIEEIEDVATIPSAYAKMGEGGRERDGRIVEYTKRHAYNSA